MRESGRPAARMWERLVVVIARQLLGKTMTDLWKGSQAPTITACRRAVCEIFSGSAAKSCALPLKAIEETFF